MKRWLKWLGIALLIPVVLVFVVSVLLYIPFVQDFTVKTASGYAEKATGMKFDIGTIRLSFPLKLKIQDATVINKKDTVLDLDYFQINVALYPLLRKEVHIREIDLKGVSVNTGDLIEGMSMKGKLKTFKTTIDKIDLGDEIVRLDKVELSDTDIFLAMGESTESDTTSSETKWKIILNELVVDNVSYGMTMDHDSLSIGMNINKALLTKGVVDLGKTNYEAALFQINKSSFSYDMFDGDTTQNYVGFNPSHISLEDINIKISDVNYDSLNFGANLEMMTAIERSGLEIVSMKGSVKSDEQTLSVPDLVLKTGASDMILMANVPWSALEKNPSGSIRAILKGEIGKNDVLLFSGIQSEEFAESYPDNPIALTAGVDGNASNLNLREMSVTLPGAMYVNVTGNGKNILDDKRRTLAANLEAKTENLDFILTLLEPTERDRYRIPQMMLNGDAEMKGDDYKANLELLEGSGRVSLDANCNMAKETYAATFAIDSLLPTDFLPLDSIYSLSASIHAEGKGFEPFASTTWAKLKGDISDIRYGNTSLSDVKMDGSLENHMLLFNLNSGYPLAKMVVDLNGTLRKEKITAALTADVGNLDLYGLHLMSDPLSMSFKLTADAATDMKIDNSVNLELGDWTLISQGKTYHPKNLVFDAFSRKDSVYAYFNAGDMSMTLVGDRDIEAILARFDKINEVIKEQNKKYSKFDLEGIKEYFPHLDFNLVAHKDNPIYNVLQQYDISFSEFEVDACLSPSEGLFIDADIAKLLRDTTMIDSICFIVKQDSLGLLYDAHVVKNQYRKQLPFKALLSGSVRSEFMDARLKYWNDKQELGMDIGAMLSKPSKDEYKVKLIPEEPVIAAVKFDLNPDNYILYKDIKDIAANVRLRGDNDASFWIHSLAEEGEDSTGYRVLQAELSQLNLKQISESFSGAPLLGGIFNADLQYAPSDTNFMVTGTMHIDTLMYEKQRVGELMFTTVYLPLGENQHQVDAHFFRDESEIMTVNADYRMGEKDFLTGSLDILDLPLEMANPFIPYNMAKMAGCLNGEMTIDGEVSTPKLNGYMRLDTASVFVTAIGSSIKFDSKAVEVKENLIKFNNYSLYSSGKNPFVIDGTIDIDNPSRMLANLTLKASNMELLNVKKNKESMVYGKLLVDINSTVKGPLESLTMRGYLRLLGGTNLTYVMQDASPTVQDKLSELVTFTDFSDTTTVLQNKNVAPLPVGGLSMLMTVMIDQSVKINVDITQDQSSRVELEGGGDLAFQYTPQGDMFLNGTYTLTGGTVKYAIPVIPLKTFNIQNGSYVQWTGDMMDPRLNLTATESIRATVSESNGGSRVVTFNVGLSLTETLENLDMKFVISAPEDQTMQQELDRLGAEQQSQIAVTMLVTGMYINMNSSGGEKVNFNMGSALNSLLQSEINKIAGSALKSVDITVGMDQYDQNGSEGGGQRTDFSFRFAKRFYNDRISIIIGGKVSTGQDVNNTGQNQPFIDNVSIEYRLDSSGTRYIKLFHDVNYNDLLEGEVTETGAGIVLRKKMLHLRELFIFKKNKTKPVDDKKEQDKEKVENDEQKTDK